MYTYTHTHTHTVQTRVLFSWRAASTTFSSSITCAMNRYHNVILKSYWDMWTDFAQSKEQRAEHVRGILNKMKNWLLNAAFQTFAERCVRVCMCACTCIYLDIYHVYSCIETENRRK